MAGVALTLRDELKALTPRLRRYARALTTGSPGGCEAADELVHTTLMRTLGTRTLGTRAEIAIRCYATLTQLHRAMAEADRAGAAKPPVRTGKLTTALMGLPLDDREALLLVALETFDHGEAARILRISRSALLARLTRARTALDTLMTLPAGEPVDGGAAARPYLRLVK